MFLLTFTHIWKMKFRKCNFAKKKKNNFEYVVSGCHAGRPRNNIVPRPSAFGANQGMSLVPVTARKYQAGTLCIWIMEME